ncbi:MAG: CHAD domain-containing protein [Sphingomonas sp.]
MSHEIELKLEVDPDNVLLVRQDPIFARAESHSRDQVTVYYDTPETKLKKHGFTLRVRHAGDRFIQTLKSISDRVGLVAREEIEFEVGALKPDLRQLLDHPVHRLLAKGEAKRLKPIIRCDVNRTSWQIEARGGRMQADFDHGCITAGERSEEFAELEFELVDGSPASLVFAAGRLCDHVPVRLGVLTKAERGFMLAAGTLGQVTKAAPVNVHPHMSVAQAFELIVHACLKHYRLNEPLALEADAAALHQGRVAMRRLRSAFALFRPAIEDVEYQHLRHELRWFTAQLGDARNLDVYLERDLKNEERSRLTRKREKAYADVADAMNSHRFRRLLIDIVGWVALGAWRTGKIAKRPLASFANRRLDRLWLSIASDRGIAGMDEDTRHRVRIQAKKMRYAVEFVQGLYPQARIAEKQFTSAIEGLQESLGKLNDIVTARTIATVPASDGWLIGSLEERRHLITAQHALRELMRVGRFWRPSAHRGRRSEEQALA